ncbi:hypothetical protein HPB50_020375 [Hyalomma asiaticum]|uniref:Uncharacterized protein n=1 Tax=Hyalomma asiaticum TaxID=266040 RepID=A0ACB7SRT3_HYAAI|nr:hypothetical protein HPB50_020375 [Hyalomma asiaticum]
MRDDLARLKASTEPPFADAARAYKKKKKKKKSKLIFPSFHVEILRVIHAPEKRQQLRWSPVAPYGMSGRTCERERDYTRRIAAKRAEILRVRRDRLEAKSDASGLDGAAGCCVERSRVAASHPCACAATHAKKSDLAPLNTRRATEAASHVDWK